jgi:hypothetical protein
MRAGGCLIVQLEDPSISTSSDMASNCVEELHLAAVQARRRLRFWYAIVRGNRANGEEMQCKIDDL